MCPTSSEPRGLAASVFLGAVLLGGLGFTGGFFGPLIFTPEANQGPLLGIFITGPLGFFVGGVAGFVHWTMRGSRAVEHLRGRGDVRMSTDEILGLTRDEEE